MRVARVIYGPAALLNPDCHLKRCPVVSTRCTAWSAISFEFLSNKKSFYFLLNLQGIKRGKGEGNEEEIYWRKVWI